MGATAQFNFAKFAARYPAFATLDQQLASAYFDEATLYLANDGTGPVENADQQFLLLNMLTAHIAQLNALVAGAAGGQQLASGGLVGQLTSASEGSVSISTTPLDGGSSAMATWLNQTPYGAAFWAATVRWRNFRYRSRAGRFDYPFATNIRGAY